MSEREIKMIYLKAPSWEEISAFIEELNVSYTQFERYFVIPEGVLRHVKQGERNLPVKFWPIIYERIVPQYGLNCNNIVKKSSKISTRIVTISRLENKNHDRLNKVK